MVSLDIIQGSSASPVDSGAGWSMSWGCPLLSTHQTPGAAPHPSCGRQERLSMPQPAPQTATHADPTKSRVTSQSSLWVGWSWAERPGSRDTTQATSEAHQAFDAKCREKVLGKGPEEKARGGWGSGASTQCSRVRRTGQRADQGVSAVGTTEGAHAGGMAGTEACTKWTGQTTQSCRNSHKPTHI